MIFKDVLTKMRTEIGSPIQYFLKSEKDEVYVNSLLGETIEINFCGYRCLNCGSDKKTFRQGHCYDCFYALPQMADWIMRPELSKAHLGIEERDLAYEEQVQLKPHIVYLALSSEIKVGVTRKGQVPTRWIDQGANEALEIIETPNRYLAGIAEVALKGHVADKTNWRKMLKNDIEPKSLLDAKKRLVHLIPNEVKQYVASDDTSPTLLDFPVLKYPEKVKSLNLAKTPTYSGKLCGIKGQYLIFEDDTVFNVRS
ncbi:MAG: DUF2797 domain-containing protein, partial [Flavobacteriales bacterium]|nr:DUF2797 domain-containing protein [Flavobacteriales bacterium]